MPRPTCTGGHDARSRTRAHASTMRTALALAVLVLTGCLPSESAPYEEPTPLALMGSPLAVRCVFRYVDRVGHVTDASHTLDCASAGDAISWDTGSCERGVRMGSPCVAGSACVVRAAGFADPQNGACQ